MFLFQSSSSTHMNCDAKADYLSMKLNSFPVPEKKKNTRPVTPIRPGVTDGNARRGRRFRPPLLLHDVSASLITAYPPTSMFALFWCFLRSESIVEAVNIQVSTARSISDITFRSWYMVAINDIALVIYERSFSTMELNIGYMVPDAAIWSICWSIHHNISIVVRNRSFNRGSVEYDEYGKRCKVCNSGLFFNPTGPPLEMFFPCSLNNPSF